jgi:hypothetical protein
MAQWALLQYMFIVLLTFDLLGCVTIKFRMSPSPQSSALFLFLCNPTAPPYYSQMSASVNLFLYVHNFRILRMLTCKQSYTVQPFEIDFCQSSLCPRSPSAVVCDTSAKFAVWWCSVAWAHHALLNLSPHEENFGCFCFLAATESTKNRCV